MEIVCVVVFSWYIGCEGEGYLGFVEGLGCVCFILIEFCFGWCFYILKKINIIIFLIN